MKRLPSAGKHQATARSFYQNLLSSDFLPKYTAFFPVCQGVFRFFFRNFTFFLFSDDSPGEKTGAFPEKHPCPVTRFSISDFGARIPPEAYTGRSRAAIAAERSDRPPKYRLSFLPRAQSEDTRWFRLLQARPSATARPFFVPSPPSRKNRTVYPPNRFAKYSAFPENRSVSALSSGVFSIEVNCTESPVPGF